MHNNKALLGFAIVYCIFISFGESLLTSDFQLLGNSAISNTSSIYLTNSIANSNGQTWITSPLNLSVAFNISFTFCLSNSSLTCQDDPVFLVIFLFCRDVGRMLLVYIYILVY